MTTNSNAKFQEVDGGASNCLGSGTHAEGALLA
jgi:hypothetical protein